MGGKSRFTDEKLLGLWGSPKAWVAGIKLVFARSLSAGNGGAPVPSNWGPVDRMVLRGLSLQTQGG